MNKDKIQSLVPLRVLALIIVILYHLFPYKVSGGILGVVIFFELAGFLTYRKLDNLIENNTLNLRDIILKKLEKLFVPLFFIIVLSLSWSYIFQKQVFYDSIDSAIGSVFAVDNIRQIMSKLSYFDRHGVFNMFTHLWALSLEVQFYILFPIFISITSKQKTKKLQVFSLILISIISIFLMIHLSLSKAEFTRIYYGTDTRIFNFTVGALAYYFSKKITITKTYINNTSYTITKYIFYIITIIPFFVSNSQEISMYTLVLPIYTIFISIFIVLLSLENKVYYDDKVHTNKTNIIFLNCIDYLSDRSYYLYVWQFIIMELFRDYFSNIPTNFVLFNISQICLVLLMSEFVHIIFSRYYSYKKYIALTSFIIIIIFSLLPKDMQYINSRQQLKSELMKNQQEENLDIYQEKLILNQKLNLIRRKEFIAKFNAEENKKTLDKVFTDKQIKLLQNSSVTLVGDSVALGAKPRFEYLIGDAYVDCKVSRQFHTGVNIIENLYANGLLKDIVVIALGSNGPFTQNDMERIYACCKGKKLLFVNCVVPEAIEKSSNEKIQNFVKNNKDVYLVDWYAFAKNKPEIFYKDKTHPIPEGASMYADLIAKKIIELKK